MRKLLIMLIAAVLVVTGCAQSKKQNEAYGDGITNAEERSSESAETKGVESAETENTNENIKNVEVKGNLWLGEISTVYTRDKESVYAYLYSDKTLTEQPLKKAACDIGRGYDTTLYYYLTEGQISAISEFEDTSDTVYAIDGHIVLLVDEGGWEKKIYRVHMDSASGERLAFDFGSLHDAVVIDVRISPDHTKGILTLEATDADCIYYLADFRSGEVTSLNELYDIPVYKRENGKETVTSRLRFADDHTIIAAVKRNDSFALVQYGITDCQTKKLLELDGNLRDICVGKKHTVIIYGDSKIAIVSNDNGEVIPLNILVNGYTSMYGMENGKYALLNNRAWQRFNIINLETGKSIEGNMGGNTFAFVVAEDGNIIKYEEMDDGSIDFTATEYFMP